MENSMESKMTYKGQKVVRKRRSLCGNFYTLYFADNSSIFVHKDDLK